MVSQEKDASVQCRHLLCGIIGLRDLGLLDVNSAGDVEDRSD